LDSHRFGQKDLWFLAEPKEEAMKKVVQDSDICPSAFGLRILIKFRNNRIKKPLRSGYVNAPKGRFSR